MAGYRNSLTMMRSRVLLRTGVMEMGQLVISRVGPESRPESRAHVDRNSSTSTAMPVATEQCKIWDVHYTVHVLNFKMCLRLLTQLRQVWCVCSVKTVCSIPERFRDELLAMGRYTDLCTFTLLHLYYSQYETRTSSYRTCECDHGFSDVLVMLLRSGR